MKKNLLPVAATAAAVSLVLTACGGSAASAAPAASSTVVSSAAENANSILDEIRAANQLDDMLAANGKIGIVETLEDADGNVQLTNTDVFVAGQNGTEFYMNGEMDGNHNLVTYKAAGENPFAGYFNNNGEYTLMLVPEDDIETLLGFYYVPDVYGTETVTESSEQDGYQIVIVDNMEDGVKVGDTNYCVEPDTLRLIAINRTYLEDDGSVASTERYLFTYGDDVDDSTITDVAADMTGAADTCTLTAVYHPGQSNEQTATYTAAKNAYVSVFNDDGVAYLDAELTNPAYGLTLDSDEMTLYMK